MPPKPGITRQSQIDTRTQYLGAGKELAEDELPTVRSCLRYCIYLRANNKDKELSATVMAKEVYSKLTQLYFKANAKLVPPVIMDEKAAVKKIVGYWVDVNTVLRRQKGYKTTQKRSEAQLDKLLDILQCKCEINCAEIIECLLAKCSSHMKNMTCVKNCSLDNCPHKQVKSCVKQVICSLASCSHVKTISCQCPKEFKLPKLDLPFIRAQRLKVGDKSAYRMGQVDKREIMKQQATLNRKEQEKVDSENRNEKNRIEKEETNLRNREAIEFLSEMPDDSSEQIEDTEFVVKAIDDKLRESVQNRMNFPTVAGVSLRYGASDRMTAAIATAALIDAGLVTENDSMKVLDHHKVHREKVKHMNNLKAIAEEKYKEGDIRCILFDGRKNWTNVMEKDESTGKYYQTRVKMEHIVVTSEPGGEYLFHFVPDEATKEIKAAKQVALKIVDWLHKFDVDETLDSLGGDSTNMNTGWDGGSFTLIESLLGKKKTWLVCSLHLNELPLRHLIQDLDGKTNSDHSFSGPIGKALDNAVNLEINPKFQAITVGRPLIALDQDVIDDLSSDQKYGYRMVMAIRAGKVPTDLALLDIGPVFHARWLTTANRVLRIWVTKHGFKGTNLTNLRMIVEYIVGVYYPVWFEIKVKHNYTYGPRHLLTQLELVRMQKKKVQNIVAPHIARSAWYSHSEAVLQTLLCSEDSKEREKAVGEILKLRGGREKGDLSNRSRVHSETFNPNAKTVSELCSWDSNVHEPVYTCELSLSEIKEFLEAPMVMPYRPVHGQSMERAVKEVTRACEAVYGEAARDGFIRAGVASRQVMPKNRTKKDLARMAGN